jgi:hypothetical protein
MKYLNQLRKLDLTEVVNTPPGAMATQNSVPGDVTDLLGTPLIRTSESRVRGKIFGLFASYGPLKLALNPSDISGCVLLK